MLLGIQGAMSHTYGQAFLTGARTNAGASALYEGLEHDNVVYYVLNVTGVRALSGASLVFGNASLHSEVVVPLMSLDSPVDGDFYFEGSFHAGNFTEQYPWSLDGLLANVGLGHIWAVLSNDKPYENTILSGQLLQKSGAQLTYADHLSDIADEAEAAAGGAPDDGSDDGR
ncbi:hypothetical protein N2152v2_005524 [Parachlorella kessleri]